MRSLHVLAVEPYCGGSHRAFLEGVVRHSCHRWTIVDDAAKHWKWRMRVAPLLLAQAACQAVDDSGPPNVIFCSDMLDLPAWLGMVQRLGDGMQQWADVPIVIYFHENQWTYPRSPQARVDLHYGYTNLLSAIASTQCILNSAFHLDSFLTASQAFVSRMPDSKSNHDFAALRAKTRVIPTGFDPPQPLPDVIKLPDAPITIGWVSRWEHDKRPDLFLELLNRLEKLGIDFRLVLLGLRPDDHAELKEIRHRFGARIIVDQFAETKMEYWHYLGQIDVVVSTADHEFFGIAVCEAIWAGAAPVLPNRLSYPELVPAEGLYETLDEAAELVASLIDPTRRRGMANRACQSISKYQMQHTVPLLDETIVAIADRYRSRRT